MKISLQTKPLYIPLKNSFKQASFNRKRSESIWVEVNRNGITGFGEGCPRTYVTGENIPESIAWITENTDDFCNSCTNLESLKNYIKKYEQKIDKHPAAWCAVELALLDLFSRERSRSVEGLLNIPEINDSPFQYTAVLSDDEPGIFEQKLMRFKQIGFDQYKVKISGNIDRDKLKFNLIQKILNTSNHSIRVDANNLWANDIEEANNYFKLLNIQLLGIEEPFSVRNFKAIASLSHAQKTAAILDESGARKNDLQDAVDSGANVILNIKVAKAGGILRSLDLIDFAKELKIPIIIGAHVGETSVLTRAGMLLANYIGPQLIGLEGGFGEYLLERDIVEPVLQIGKNGQINLGKTYSYPGSDGPASADPQNWNSGWGLQLKNQL